MSYVFLILGTIGSIVFIVMLFKGSEYEYMLESLSGDAFPLKIIYTVGLALQDRKLFRLRGKIGDQLRNDSTLFYSKQYSEYYARIIWAQILSFSLLSCSVFFLLAGALGEKTMMFFGVTGIVLGAICAYYFAAYTKDKIETRKNVCESEFPNAISKLALIVNSGMILHDAWKLVAEGNEGVFYKMMQDSCEDMNNGKADVDAIYEFGVLTNSDDIKKFTTALIQSIERGGSDLPQFLVNQSTELWARRRQIMLQKGEKAAGALLMPIMLMFIGVIMIVLSAAMQSFTF